MNPYERASIHPDRIDLVTWDGEVNSIHSERIAEARLEVTNTTRYFKWVGSPEHEPGRPGVPCRDVLLKVKILYGADIHVRLQSAEYRVVAGEMTYDFAIEHLNESETVNTLSNYPR